MNKLFLKRNYAKLSKKSLQKNESIKNENSFFFQKNAGQIISQQ